MGATSKPSLTRVFSATALVFVLSSISMAAIPGKSIVQAAVTTTETVVVDVDFTSASVSGSTITNNAPGKLADLTQVGSSTINSTDGINFANTSGSTAQYLRGNIGPTTNMTKIVVEMVAKFPDQGCALSNNGSMVFGLGSSSSIYVPYNIYRHSDLIGVNTFSADILGINRPDADYHRYKFVMVNHPAPRNTQEIYLDNTLQTLTATPTSAGNSACGGGGLSATEISANRIFTGGTGPYSSGDFALMTHPLNFDFWRTTGAVKSLKITTTTTIGTPEAPSAPTINTLTPGDGSLSVAFSAPATDGGASISGYRFSTDNGSTWSTSASRSNPFTISGLTNTNTYQVKLRAVNTAGDGSISSAVSGTPIANRTVTYNAQGGSNVSAGSFQSGGEINAAPTNPTRNTFDFLGWSLTSTGSVVTFPYSPTSDADLVLFAIWQTTPVQSATPTPTPVVETITPAPTSTTSATPTPSATPKPKSGASASPKQTDNPESIESPTPEPTPIESAESQPNPLATDESFNIDSASEKELNSSDNRPLFAFLVFGTLVFLLLIVKRSRKKH